MNLAPATKIKWMLGGLLGAIWTFPLVHWAHTMTQVIQVNSDNQSIDSKNDVTWNCYIGLGYFLCLVSSVGAIAFLKPAKSISWLGVLAGILTAGFFCLFPYDGIIIIAPMVNPFTPTIIGICCFFCTGISWAYSHRHSAGKISFQ